MEPHPSGEAGTVRIEVEASVAGTAVVRLARDVSNSLLGAPKSLKGYALHFAPDNFCRVHQTLRLTPAMESRLTDAYGASKN
jgi:hypothetical protein